MSFDPRGRLFAPPEPEKPQLIISQPDWQRLMGYVQLCEEEINGFGLVEIVGNHILVNGVFITRQTVGPGSAEVDEADVHHLMYQLTEKGINTGKLRLQWHSHVHMPAYFSGVDTHNIEQYPGDWMISLVLNKFGQYSARLDLFKPFRVTVEELPVRIQQPALDPRIEAECRGEITTKVRRQVLLGKRAYRPAANRLPNLGDLEADEIELWEAPQP